MADMIEASLLVVGAVATAAAVGGLLVDSRAELLVAGGLVLGVEAGLATDDGAVTVVADEEVVFDLVLDLSSVAFALASVVVELEADFSLTGGLGAGGGRVIMSTMNFFSSILYSDNLLSSANIFPE